MTDNEKLIEDARRAYLDAWAATNLEDVRPGTRNRNGIIAALAVFEKALTPTNDERAWAEYRDADPANNTPDQRRAFFAGFRRTEAPEPSAEPRCEHGTSLTDLCEHVERLVNAEPQGEPSSEVAEPSTEPDALCGDWPAPCNCDDPVTHDGSVPASIVQSERAEPSDAQVEAALQALGHSRSGVTPPAMRAALRAASSVTKGENR